MEEYKQIEDYENYGISRCGKVKNFKTGRILKSCSFGRYVGLQLFKNNRGKSKLIHRLVALAYIPNPENKPEVDHIDRNKLNNHVDNLRWATREEQMENRGDFKNNKLNEKYIHYWNNSQGYYYYKIRIVRNGKNLLDKSFNITKYTLEEVVKYRDDFLASIN